MYNFDEIIDRRNTDAFSTDGFREGIFNDDTMEFPYKDEDFIRMWIADMEFATPDVIINAVKERLDKRILGYTGIFSNDYYESFLNWCKRRYHWEFKKEELLTSTGIVPALYDLVEYITKADEKILINTPSYGPFKYAAEHNNRDYICSDLIDENGYYTFNFEDFERKASDEKTTLFMFCNPHNPTGRVWTEEELNRLAEIIERYDLWVISDEIHCDLTRKNKEHIPLGKIMPNYKKIITCMASSKTFNLAGMMISNIIIRDEKIREIWTNRQHSMKNPLSMVASKAAYEKGELWLDELTNYLDENFKFTKAYLKEHLPKAIFSIPEATYLAWINLKEYFNKDEDLSRFFAYNAGVLLEGGNMFVQNGDNYIRLNLACPRSVLEEGLRRICQAINEKER